MEEDSYDVFCDALLEQDPSMRIQALRNLIRKGADVNSHDCHGSSVVALAVSYGYDECVRLLFEAGADVDQWDSFNTTPLTVAAENGYVHCVRSLLLVAGAEVNTPDMDGETALFKALRKEYVECVRLLLKVGVDMDQVDKEGKTALMVAAESNDDKSPCVQLLLEAGANANEFDYRGQTALKLAAYSGHVEFVRQLLKAGAEVNQLDSDDGETALMRAGRNGHVECVSLILEAGADVNTASEWGGQTALVQAVSCSNVDCVRVLLEAGAEVNDNDVEMARDTALMYCLSSYCYGKKAKQSDDCLKLLINAGTDIDVKTIDNLQPIHFALMIWPEFKFPAEFLISRNCDLSQVSFPKVDADEFIKKKDRLDILKYCWLLVDFLATSVKLLFLSRRSLP